MIEGILIPPRTTVHISGVLSLEGLLQPEGGLDITIPLTVNLDSRSYVCKDCGYGTPDVVIMSRHQEGQARIHTRWQRFRRWVLTANKQKEEGK